MQKLNDSQLRILNLWLGASVDGQIDETEYYSTSLLYLLYAIRKGEFIPTSFEDVIRHWGAKYLDISTLLSEINNPDEIFLEIAIQKPYEIRLEFAIAIVDMALANAHLDESELKYLEELMEKFSISTEDRNDIKAYLRVKKKTMK